MEKINFAYKTFKWNSEASEKAAVHCIIVGFSYAPNYIIIQPEYGIITVDIVKPEEPLIKVNARCVRLAFLLVTIIQYCFLLPFCLALLANENKGNLSSVINWFFAKIIPLLQHENIL